MRIYSKTVTELIYVDGRGQEQRLRDIDDKHLLNAFEKSIREEGGDEEPPRYSELIREEIQRRLRLRLPIVDLEKP